MGAITALARNDGRTQGADDWSRRTEVVRTHAEAVRLLAIAQGAGLGSGASQQP